MNLAILGGFFDYDAKNLRLKELKKEFENPELWKNKEKSQTLGKEKASLEKLIVDIDDLHASLNDLSELHIILDKENDIDAVSYTHLTLPTICSV